MSGEKILYFDCASGISGDMVLGALLDLGADAEAFRTELSRLSLPGCEVVTEEVQKNGIRARHARVLVDGKDAEQAHAHGQEGHGHGGHTKSCHGDENPGNAHAHVHRSFADIRRLIGSSDLKQEVKDLSLRIFTRVAQAEAKVHGKPVDEVHFHEVGAVDSIVDIVGCAILIDLLNPRAVYASALQEGHGYVACQHGLLSVPVPATSEILAASDAVLRQVDVEGELVTPTGAAIIAELAKSYAGMPPMKIEKIGWGAGTKDLPIPNILKVYEGYTAQENEGETGHILHDEIIVLETNLDDCTGEELGYALRLLLEAGALDVSNTPIYMKKNRPAWKLTVLARPEDADRLEKLIFRHTTTIGIRRRTEQRSILRREQTTVGTPFGELKAKKVFLDKEERIYPEYESAVDLAEKNNRPLREMLNAGGNTAEPSARCGE